MCCKESTPAPLSGGVEHDPKWETTHVPPGNRVYHNLKIFCSMVIRFYLQNILQQSSPVIHTFTNEHAIKSWSTFLLSGKKLKYLSILVKNNFLSKITKFLPSINYEE